MANTQLSQLPPMFSALDYDAARRLVQASGQFQPLLEMTGLPISKFVRKARTAVTEGIWYGKIGEHEFSLKVPASQPALADAALAAQVKTMFGAAINLEHVKTMPCSRFVERVLTSKNWKEVSDEMPTAERQRRRWLLLLGEFFGETPLWRVAKMFHEFRAFVRGFDFEAPDDRVVSPPTRTLSYYVSGRATKSNFLLLDEFCADEQSDWRPRLSMKVGRARRRTERLTRSEIARLMWAAYRGWIWDPKVRGWATETVVCEKTGVLVTRRKRLPVELRAQLKSLARFILIGAYTGTRQMRNRQLGWAATADRGWIEIRPSNHSAPTAVIHRSGLDKDYTGKPASSTRVLARIAAHLARWRRLDTGLPHGLGDADPDMFVTSAGALDSAAFRDVWNICRDAAGLPKTTVPHLLKHFCCTEMMKAKMSIRVIAYLVDTHPRTLIEIYHQELAGEEAEREALPHGFVSDPVRLLADKRQVSRPPAPTGARGRTAARKLLASITPH